MQSFGFSLNNEIHFHRIWSGIVFHNFLNFFLFISDRFHFEFMRKNISRGFFLGHTFFYFNVKHPKSLVIEAFRCRNQCGRPSLWSMGRDKMSQNYYWRFFYVNKCAHLWRRLSRFTVGPHCVAGGMNQRRTFHRCSHSCQKVAPRSHVQYKKYWLILHDRNTDLWFFFHSLLTKVNVKMLFYYFISIYMVETVDLVSSPSSLGSDGCEDERGEEEKEKSNERSYPSINLDGRLAVRFVCICVCIYEIKKRNVS